MIFTREVESLAARCQRASAHDITTHNFRMADLTITAAATAAGGPALRAVALTDDLFAAAAMVAVQKDLLAMKVTELKDELKERGESTAGNKPFLRRRLHAAILRRHLDAEDDADGLGA